MSESSEALKRKILALIAKSEGTTNEHESLAFAEKARQLMEEHKLTMGELYMSKDPLGDFVVNLPSLNDGAVAVMVAGANYFGAAVAYYQTAFNDPVFKIVGHESARTVAAIMIPFWWDECSKRAQALTKERSQGECFITINLFGQPVQMLITNAEIDGERTVEQMMMAFSNHLILTAERNKTLDPKAIDEARQHSGAQEDRRINTSNYYIPPDVVDEAQKIPLDMQLGGASENGASLPKK